MINNERMGPKGEWVISDTDCEWMEWNYHLDMEEIDGQLKERYTADSQCAVSRDQGIRGMLRYRVCFVKQIRYIATPHW